MDTGHLLPGVSRAARGVAARVLIDADLSSETLRRELAARSSTGEKISTSVAAKHGRSGSGFVTAWKN